MLSENNDFGFNCIFKKSMIQIFPLLNAVGSKFRYVLVYHYPKLGSGWPLDY